MKKFLLLILMISASMISCSEENVEKQNTVVGADILMNEKFDLIKGKNVGLIVNHTALLSDGTHLADAINENEEVELAVLFGPEHGVRGDTTGAVKDAIDTKTGAPIYSLYGKSYKPAQEQLENVDVLIYDIQDVGARFYTYISTLGHVMEAAADAGIPVIVLDRPNPITGLKVDGFVTEDSMKSFVAFGKLPVMHGMTVGEIAKIYNGEGMLGENKKADLTVVEMKNWTRDLWFDETNLRWVKTSPNLPVLETAVVYPGTCFFEGTNISEGRGTEKPFEFIGAPYADADSVAALLNKQNLKGVQFEAIEFTPEKLPQNAYAPKYTGEKCKGVYVNVVNRDTFEPVKTGVNLLWAFHKVNPDEFKWREKTIDRLAATPDLRKMINDGKTPDEIAASWKNDLEQFMSVRKNYLLYE